MSDDTPPPDGAPTLASVPPGAKFDRYEVIRMIGSGGMGSVYEARHVDLDKRVALKVLSQRIAQNKVYLGRFLREGRIAAKLDHPHVVSVFDVGTHAGKPYLVMEFLSGRDLASLLEERGRLGVEEAIELLLPILAALAVAHETGLVHRDIKPANLFLQRAAHGGWHPKLLDFGIAKPNHDETAALTGTGEIFGTPQYMAPEQVRRTRDATSRSDEYAMGAVLYRCLAGVEAFELGTASSVYDLLERVVSGSFQPLRSVQSDIPSQLEAVVHRAMSRAPEQRFTTVRDFGAALLPFASPSARHLWTTAFARPDAVAETLPPDVGDSMPTATVASSSGPVITAANSAPSDPAAHPSTLTAAARDTTPKTPLAAAAVTSRRRTMIIGVGGAVLGAAATLYLAGALFSADDKRVPPAASSIATREQPFVSSATATAPEPRPSVEPNATDSAPMPGDSGSAVPSAQPSSRPSGRPHPGGPSPSATVSARPSAQP
ncbi:MAG: protein kinase, partial [Myxococcales bacterium]|nr:protein kinase [Myxococcales bacterium]